MKMERISEVGVAVKNLEDTSRKYVEILGAIPSEMMPIDQYGNRCQMCRIGDVDLRLMEATRDNEVARLVEKRHGDWIYYVGFQVPNIDEAIAWMKQKNIRMIDEAPRSENGQRFAFVHPDSFKGVTFKLIEGEHSLKYLPESPAQKAIPAAARITRLYHVGVNVIDLEAANRRYAEVLGARLSTTVTVDMYEQRVTMGRIGDKDFELLSPTSPDGLLGRQVAKIGEGLSQLAFSVPDIRATIAWMMQNGLQMINETPVKPSEAMNWQGAFVHPKGFNGVMFEWLEGLHGLFEEER